MKGHKHTPETKAKMSAAHKGHTSGIAGKHMSDEARHKMSLKRKGVPKSEETKIKIGNANRGLKRSAEQTLRNSITHRGKILSPESKAKASASLKGRIVSAETRAKLSYIHSHLKYDHKCTRISKSQRVLFNFLKNIYPDAELEYPISAGNRWYVLDIAIPSLMLDCEYDGTHWHNMAHVKARDIIRDIKLKELGWAVIRIKDDKDDEELKTFMEVSR